ncbi:MAG: MerR family transcriptional regulator [Myxococcales bacterium]|nr:MerR family transcriptional regulator [Myxococcales bacterium]
MRISELARRSGVRKETIHFYLREGLLPKPEKTRRNMALYDESHVERLELIRRLQTEKYLPLEVIKRVLRGGRPRGGGEDLELLAGLFHLAGASGETALGRAELLRRSGLSTEELAQAEAAGLIVRSGQEASPSDPTFAPEDLRTLELLAATARSGVGAVLAIESFALCGRHLQAMVREEARLFFDRLLHAASPMELLDGMRRAREPQARFVAHARARLLQREIADYVAQIERAVDETGGPSAFPVSEVRAARASAVTGDGPEAVEMGCLVEFSLGRIEALAALSAAGIARFGRRPRLVAMAGAAAVEQGDLDRGIALLDESCADGAMALGLALRGAARVRLGRRTTLQSGAGSALKQVAAGLEDLARIDTVPSESDALAEGERLRALLGRGRVYTSLPPFFNTRDQGIVDLRAVLAAIDRPGPRGASLAALDLLGVLAAVELNAAWFLAVAVGGAGSIEGRELLMRAARVDPEGPIARRVARALAEA